ncbi:unnamed protein product, partial [Lampetra planeri]
MFKRSKRNFRRRNASSSSSGEDGGGGDGGGGDGDKSDPEGAPPPQAASRAAPAENGATNPAAALGKAGPASVNVELEVFQLKRPSYSRKVARQLKKDYEDERGEPGDATAAVKPAGEVQEGEAADNAAAVVMVAVMVDSAEGAVVVDEAGGKVEVSGVGRGGQGGRVGVSEANGKAAVSGAILTAPLVPLTSLKP